MFYPRANPRNGRKRVTRRGCQGNSHHRAKAQYRLTAAFADGPAFHVAMVSSRDGISAVLRTGRAKLLMGPFSS